MRFLLQRSPAKYQVSFTKEPCKIPDLLYKGALQEEAPVTRSLEHKRTKNPQRRAQSLVYDRGTYQVSFAKGPCQNQVSFAKEPPKKERQLLVHIRTNIRTHTNTYTRARAHTHIHTHTPAYNSTRRGQTLWREKLVFKR